MIFKDTTMGEVKPFFKGVLEDGHLTLMPELRFYNFF